MAANAFNHSFQEAEAGGSLLSSKHNDFQKKPHKKQKKNLSPKKDKKQNQPKKI